MPCENVHIQGNLSIKGIHGKPVFNCGENCTTFLTVPFWQTNDSIKGEERAIILQNLEIRNTRCHSSLISIFHSSRIIFENVTVRDSDAPAIKVFQLDHKPIFINVKNSDFLSSYGMFMAKCNNMALLIKNCQFIGDGSDNIQGIVIRNIPQKATQTKVFIDSSSFAFLASGVRLIFASSSVISIKNSLFFGNNARRYNYGKGLNNFGSAFSCHIIQSDGRDSR